MKKIKLILLAITTSFILSGCIGVFDFVCDYAGDNDYHCHQWIAVQEEDPDMCVNVNQAEKFQNGGSNPPRDKCYLMIAEKTGDPSGCSNIKGGMMSYTVQECIWKAAVSSRNTETCYTINGSHNGFAQTYNTETCLTAIEDAGGGIESDEEYDEDELDEEIDGECKFDSDCDSICENDVMWKMGCNARTNTCEKTFDTNCESETETFSDMSFTKVCSAGTCISDENAINAKISELEIEKKRLSDEVKQIIAIRQELTSTMTDTNKKCLSGLADATNIIIFEGATRIASLSSSLSSFAMQGGRQLDIPSAMVDYAGSNVQKLFNYIDNPNPPEDQKLKLPDFIALNCKLYDYFKMELASYDGILDESLEKANKVDAQLKVLR